MQSAMKISDTELSINEILASQGVNHSFVFVKPSKENTVAYCVGVSLNNIDVPLFNLKGKVSAGIMVINEKNLKKLKLMDDEVQFILAHECSHILQNHSVTTAMWHILEQAPER